MAATVTETAMEVDAMKPKESASENDQGVALVLLLITITVILSMLALAIDVTLLHKASRSNRDHAALAALRALETYYASYCDGSCSENGMRAALQAVKDLEDQFPFTSHKDIVLADSEESIPEESAGLIFGRWTREGCTNGEEFCFSPGSSSNQRPNATKIIGILEGKITQVFSRAAFGFVPKGVTVTATASVVPRQGCFLVDVSPSIVFDTHPKWVSAPPPTPTSTPTPAPTPAPVCGAGHYYAFSMDGYNGSALDGAQYSKNRMVHDWLRNVNPVRDNSSTTACNSTHAQETELCPGAPFHCYSDYAQKATLSDDDYGAKAEYAEYHPHPSMYPAGDRKWFRVDGYQLSKPEPLSSVLSGIRSGLTEFRKRRVEGDKACLIFYDQRLEWPRIVELSGGNNSDWDYLINFVDNSSSASLISDTSAVDTTLSPPGLERTIRHGLFPKVGSYTNSQIAIAEALRQFDVEKNEAGIPVSNFITLISDGLNNCSASSGGCDNSVERHLESMAELENLAASALVPQRVPLHVLLIGGGVMPNTARCISDSEYRVGYGKDHFLLGGYVAGGPNGQIVDPDLNYPYPSSYVSQLSGPFLSGPYYHANYEWYRIAAMTRGIWGPIRAGYGGGCVDGSPNFGDPEGRSVGEQIRDYMKEIVGENPYTVVDYGY